MNPAARFLLLRELQRREQIRSIILERFELVPDPKARMRSRDVAVEVARALGVPWSPDLHRRVYCEARALGLTWVRPANKSMFAGIKPKEKR